MKPRILNASRAILCATIAATPLLAATDIWDGLGADPQLSTGANWLDDTAPLSDVLFTDLIFTGGEKPDVVVGAAFSLRSLTFDAGADIFTIAGFELTAGGGGIVNESGRSQELISQVILGAPSVALYARTNALRFGDVILGGNSAVLAGGSAVTVTDFIGDGHVQHTGTGALNFGTLGVELYDLTISGGGTATLKNNNFPFESTSEFGAGSAIVISNGSLLIENSLTLTGASLTRAAGAGFSFTASKNFALQGGATAMFAGNFTLNAANTYVTDAASTLSHGGGTFSLAPSSHLFVSTGGRVQLGGGLEIGAPMAGNLVTVDGAGSQFNLAGTASLGVFGGAGNMVFSNGAAGTFETLNLGTTTDAKSVGSLSAQTGSTITSGSLAIPSLAIEENSGNVTTDGAGSVWTMTGASALTIGAASLSNGQLAVTNGAIFHSGTGGITIAPTGVLTINGGGIFNANGNVLVDGGQVLNPVGAAISMMLAAGKTIVVQIGGSLQFCRRPRNRPGRAARRRPRAAVGEIAHAHRHHDHRAIPRTHAEWRTALHRRAHRGWHARLYKWHARGDGRGRI